jgi:subtilisin family serine protease
MDVLSQLKLEPLMAKSTGEGISVGLIDGPIDLNHEGLATSHIRTTKNSEVAACKKADNVACMHGTFVTGILTGGRGSNVPALCPDCEIILRPIFAEESSGQLELPSSTPDELAQAIVDCIKAGANIINLSVGLSTTPLTRFPQMQEAYDYAIQKGVPIVAAAGNQGQMGYFSILDNPWVIPVVGCDLDGIPDAFSNISRSIAKYGLMAPGMNVKSILAGGGFKRLSGSSFAAPFVVGTMALLWSIYKDATPQQLVISTRGVSRTFAKVFPPLCDAEKSEALLQSLVRSS